MTRMKLLIPLLLALAATGCGSPCEECASAGSPVPEGANRGPGPNGGVVFDLGDLSAEVTFDHDRWECAVVVVTGSGKTARPLPVAADVLTLTTRKTRTKDGKPVAPMNILLLPVDDRNGKASRFVGRDPGLHNAVNFAGTVAGEVNGKSLVGEYRE